MQLHDGDRNDWAGSQHNLQQGLGAAEGAASWPGPPQEQQPRAALVGGWLLRPAGRRRVPRERGQSWLQHSCCGRTADCHSNGHQLRGREATPTCDTCHGATVSHGHQPRLSPAVRAAGTSHVPEPQGASCPPQAGSAPACATSSPPGDSHSLPLQHPQRPRAKDVCKFVPAVISSLCLMSSCRYEHPAGTAPAAAHQHSPHAAKWWQDEHKSPCTCLGEECHTHTHLVPGSEQVKSMD